jgi:propionate CoA-transferase
VRKIISVVEAAELIRDDDILAFNAMGWLGNPVLFYKVLEDRFLRTEHPRGLTLYSSCGIGGRELPEMANRLAHRGLVSRLLLGHYDTLRDFFPFINDDSIEAYNLSQGILSQNLREAARHSPGFFVSIGLHTCLDPRVEGPPMNKKSQDKLITVAEQGGKEYLFFHTVYPTVCVIRGTTADVNGNITFEKEALVLDPLSLAQAVKNNNGRVIVQVERLSDSHANPNMVKVPSLLVDAIYLDPEQKQTAGEVYNGLYSGEYYAPKEQTNAYMQKLLKNAANLAVKRLAADRIIARRASLEMQKDDIVNLGIGIPTSIGLEVTDIGQLSFNDITLTVELGMMGGIPIGEASFGAVMNADAMYDQASQFEYYEGGGLDISFVGALEFDKSGNINVCQVGDKFFGLGGFNYVAETPKRLVACSKFMQGSGWDKTENGLALKNGTSCKVVKQVEHICFSGRVALERGQKVKYITERAVFELGPKGLILIEYAPGLDVARDILSPMGFPIEVSRDLKLMDQVCFMV